MSVCLLWSEGWEEADVVCLPLRNSQSVQWGSYTPPPILHIKGLREGKRPEHLDGRPPFGLRDMQEQRLGSKQPM